MEAAAGGGVMLLSLSDDQIKQTKSTKLVIPGGTYPGIDKDVATTSLPVMAYATTAMDNATAYTLTKSFWSEKAKMSADNKWWSGVKAEMLAAMVGKLHPGALKYYAEAGVKVPDALR